MICAFLCLVKIWQLLFIFLLKTGFEIPTSPVARGDQFLQRTTLILELSSPPGECKIKKSKYVNFPELYLEQFCVLLHLFIYSLKNHSNISNPTLFVKLRNCHCQWQQSYVFARRFYPGKFC